MATIRLFQEDDALPVDQFKKKYKDWSKLPEIDIPDSTFDFIKKVRNDTSIRRSDLERLATLFAEHQQLE